MAYTSVKKLEEKAFTTLKGKFGYTNLLQAPHLVKVIVTSGTGSGVKKDKNRNTLVIDRLTKITGQKPSLRSSKKSVASFKLRQGEPIGVMVTLRGARMYGFLDKFFNVAIPRTKDFRGLDAKMIDAVGNVTIPVKEHTIFPETTDEEIKDVFGLGVTIVTTAKSKDEAAAFFDLIGIPFKK